MNNIIIMGRLTRDPEVRVAQQGGTAIGRMTIAVDRRIKREGQPEADFFNVTTFGKQAEFVEKYLKKGTKILVQGEMQNNDYTDKDGVKHYGMQLIANSIEFAESKASGAPAQPQQQAPQGGGIQGGGIQGDFMNIPFGIEEELPFNV